MQLFIIHTHAIKNGGLIQIIHNNAKYIANEKVMSWLDVNHKNFEVLITQGAGTISKLNNQIKNKWQSAK